MATTADLFRAFNTKITLDESDRDRGLQRIIACTAALTEKYYPAGTAPSDKVTLIGSLGKDTGTNPIADADVMFHMPAGTWNRFTNYAGNGQSALLQEVRDVLTKRYPSTKIRGDGPVVVVSFTTAPTVEIVPTAFVSDNANILYASGEVPVTRDGGQWEFVDYGAQLNALNNADGPVDGQLRRLIRYMKAWRKCSYATLKSIVLELMAIDFMKTWDRSQTSATYDDWLVRDFLRYMIDHYTYTYPIPGTTRSIGTGVGWFLDAQESVKDADAACRYQPDNSMYLYYWRKVLGNDFGA
jgi:hypothetical protein